MGIKVNLRCEIKCKKILDDHITTMHFGTSAILILRSSMLEDLVHNAIVNLTDKISDFQRSGTGWIILGVNYISLDITSYLPTGELNATYLLF